MITNPNRFIRGLYDLSDIVDDGYDNCVNIVENAPITPVGVTASSPPSTSSVNETLDEFEVVITQDGPQIITLSDVPVAGYILFINGLRQSKSAYSVSGNTLILPGSLQIFAGDVIAFLYLK